MTTSLLPQPKARFFTHTDDGTEFLPLAGGLVHFYEPASTTEKDTYTDYFGGTANLNPVELDANGEANIWLGTGLYKVVLCNSDDVEQWTVDNVAGSGGSGGVIASVNSIAELRLLAPGSSAIVQVLGYYNPPGTLVAGYTQKADCGGGLFYWDADSTASDDKGVTIIPNTFPGIGRWVRVFDGPVSINWYGAVPNYILDNGGVNGSATDNTTFINNACAFAGANDLPVRIPAGVYAVSGAINCAVAMIGDQKPQVATNSIYGSADWGTNTDTEMEGSILIWDKSVLTPSSIYLRNVTTDLSQSVQFKNIGFMSKSSAGIGGGTLLVSDNTSPAVTSYNFGNLPAFDNCLIMNFAIGLYVETQDGTDYNNMEFIGCRQVLLGDVTKNPAANQNFNRVSFKNCGDASTPFIKLENVQGVNFNRCLFGVTSQIGIRKSISAGITFNECDYFSQKAGSGPGGITSNFITATAEASADAGLITFFKTHGTSNAGDIDLSASPVVPKLTIIDSDLGGSDLTLGATLVTELGFVNYGTLTGTGNNNKVTTDEAQLNGTLFLRSSTGNTRQIGTTTSPGNDNGSLAIGASSNPNSGFAVGASIFMSGNEAGGGSFMLLNGGDGSSPGDIEIYTAAGKSTIISNTDNSTSKDTGALIVEGGVGIEKDVFIGDDLTVTDNISAGGLISGPLIVGTDVTGSTELTASKKFSVGKSVDSSPPINTDKSFGEFVSAGVDVTINSTQITTSSFIIVQIAKQLGAGTQPAPFILNRSDGSCVVSGFSGSVAAAIGWFVINPA